ncbi:MAG: hypothetical protein OXI75_00235 [Rhodospirillales bacterium]|nr:hypothetical protein [Rhodospirillales bacterium]
MRRIAVLGCALLLMAGCGGGGGNGVEGMVTTEPPETESGAGGEEMEATEPPETESGTGGEEMGATEPPGTDSNPTLETLGAYETAQIDDAGTASTATFHRWGVWGGILRDDYVTCQAIGCPPPGETIFMAYINHENDGTVSTGTQGTRSGTSPVSGSAVWSGDVRAYETEDVTNSEGMSITTYAPVEGDARIEVDFTAVTVDIDFTNFDNDQADMSWDGLALSNGEFGSGAAGIEGAFYGLGHEGAAGTFARDGLAGVFGALRSSE